MSSGPLGVLPPNNMTLLLGKDVKVNPLQGGGASPMISGTIQWSETQTAIKLYLVYILLITWYIYIYIYILTTS